MDDLTMKVGKYFLVPWWFRTNNFMHHLKIWLVIGRDHEILDKKFSSCTCLWHGYQGANGSHDICYFIVFSRDLLENDIYKILLKIFDHVLLRKNLIIFCPILIGYFFDNQLESAKIRKLVIFHLTAWKSPMTKASYSTMLLVHVNFNLYDLRIRSLCGITNKILPPILFEWMIHQSRSFTKC